MAHLLLVSEVPDAVMEPVEIAPTGMQIGRSRDSDFQIADQRVSRLHAELVWEGGSLFLIPRSATNSTRLNGVLVEERCSIAANDTITLSESIELRVGVEDATQVAEAAGLPPVASRAPQGEPTAPPAPAPATRAVSTRVPQTAAIPIPQSQQVEQRDPKELNVVIVGAGPAGIAAGVQAAKRGVPHLLLDRTSLANTIERYQKGKLVMAEPSRLGLQADLDMGFEQNTREDVLNEWYAALERADVKTAIGPEHELASIEGQVGAFKLHTQGGGVIDATHVVVAIGVQGDLRRFGCEGDDLPHISHQLDDPADFEGKKIVVVGAGDAGIENALALVECGNDVAIVNRREEFDKAKAANRSKLQAAIETGKMTLYKNTVVDHFEERAVFLKTPEGVERIEVDLVIGRLGAIPPRKFLEAMGIEFPSESREAVPLVSDSYESNVPGIHLLGALVGYPLIKNCMNQGYEVIEHLLGSLVVPADEPVLAAVLAPWGIGVSEAIEQIRYTVPLFSSLSPIQLREFLFDSTVKKVASGETVYERNDYENTLLTIVEGRCRASTPREDIKLDEDEEGKTRLLQDRNIFLYEKGEFFGEMGLISGRRRGETVEAIEPSILIESPRLAISRLLNSSAEVRETIDQAFANHAVEKLMPGVGMEDRQFLADAAETRSYAPGKLVITQGGDADGLYLIRRGSVSITTQRDGREVVLEYVQAGNMIGNRSLLSEDRKHSANVRAKTLVETLFMPAEAVFQVFERNPNLALQLRKQMDEQAASSAGGAAAAEEHRGTVMFLIDQTGAHEATDLLLIDESLCVRCNNCEKACAETHFGVSRLDREAGPTYQTSGGAQLHLPTACQHCENPKCMDDCPPDALQRDRNGEVYVRDNCIGCGNCARNCPYDVIQMSALEEKRPPGLLWRLLFGDPVPDESGENKPKKAVKCDLCKELGEPRSGRKRAACVASCPTGAIVRADPRKLVDEVLQRI